MSEGTTEGGEGGGEGGAPVMDFSTLSDDVRPHVEKLSFEELASGYVTHKAAATRRDDTIRSNILGDEGLVNEIVEKGGFIKKPDSPDGIVELAKSQIADDTVYEASEGVDVESDVYKGLTASAKEAGILPNQFKALMDGAAKATQEASQAGFERLGEKLKESWGDDHDKNQGFIDDYFGTLKDEGMSLKSVVANLPPELQEDAANYFAARGAALAEGLPGAKGADFKSGTGDPDQDWKDARKMLSEAGGFEKLTPAQREQYEAAFNAVKAKKGA